MLKIIEPTLLLNKSICMQNIKKMAEKAKANGLIFRPHVKTHQSAEIANYFRQYGVNKITVSSLKQAIYFASNNWDDITLAFPVNILELEKIKFLSRSIKLNLLVESVFVTEFLSKHLEHSVGLFIKIDSGYHRTGVDPSNINLINAILNVIENSEHLSFKGFLLHAGHSYAATSYDEIETVHKQSKNIIKNLKKEFYHRYPNLIASIGDTPTCSQMNDFDSIDEIRPGTFVFNDLAQWKIGACTLNEIAIAMSCPVVAKHPERNEVVIYGGAVHFSKDFSFLPSGEKYFGLAVENENNGWNVNNILGFLKAVSQEHGIVKLKVETITQIKEGDILTILPIHSCLTGNLMKEYYSIDGEKITRL